MSEADRVYQLNLELARRINEELLHDPNHPYTGKWIGLANGHVAIVADSRDEVFKRLDEIEPNPRRSFFLEGVGIPEEEANAIYGA